MTSLSVRKLKRKNCIYKTKIILILSDGMETVYIKINKTIYFHIYRFAV